MFPSAELKPYYDSVIWLWVYRDFKKGPADLTAERVHNRFGVSSWPQLFFFDGSSTVLVECGRTVVEFKQAADTALEKIAKPDPAIAPLLQKMQAAKKLIADRKDASKALAAFQPSDPGEFHLEARELLGLRPATEKDLTDLDADRRADALDLCLAKKVPVAKEFALHRDPDADVRLRAVAYLAAVSPDRLAAVLGDLLSDAMDGVKYAALDAVKAAPDPKCGPALCDAWRALGAGKIPSRNPNVVRMKLAEVLGPCGGDDAVPLLESIASKRDFLNGTTTTSVRALGQLGKRKAKGAAAALLKCFPDAVTPEIEKSKRAPNCIALARAVHEALTEACGEPPAAFPKTWTGDDRSRLLEAWSRRVK